MVEPKEFGKKLLEPHCLIQDRSITQMKEQTSRENLEIAKVSGTQLRVLASTVAVSTMSATTATVGLFLLSLTSRTACSSSTMASSIRRTPTPVERAVYLSVVSKNKF